jgi:hypothetical protein
MIISPQLPQPIISNPAEILQASKPATNLPLAVGEQVEALVLGQDRQQKVLLQMKNTVITADSRLPLKQGEKLTLCVDQLHPSIVLKVTAREMSETQKVNEFLRMYRSNPDALKDWITTAKDFLSGDNLKDITTYIGKKDLQALQKGLDKIIMTKDSLTNPLFVKKFVASLGLTLEKTLRKALSDPSALKNDIFTDNLKLLLLKTESMLQGLPLSHAEDETGTSQLIKSLLNFTELGEKIIEHYQIINCLAQEQDNLFVLQIPFQHPDGIRTQDIFIEVDHQKSTSDPDRQYRVVLFLDMDALGKVVCDISIKNKHLNCTLTSKDQDTCDFLSDLLKELQDKLSASGYDCGSLKCIVDRLIASRKQEFLNKHKVFSQNTINLSI